MRSDDPNPQVVQLWEREDYKTSTSALMCLQQVQDKGMPHIPMHMTTRTHNTLDPTIQQKLEWLSQNWQTQFSTPVFGWMDKTRHGGILNTGKNLSSGESGNQRSGKTKSGRRNGKRRQQSSIRKLMRTSVVSTVAQVALRFQFLQSCTFTSHVNFLCNRFRVQTVVNVANATGDVQITPHRVRTQAPFFVASHISHKGGCSVSTKRQKRKSTLLQW